MSSQRPPDDPELPAPHQAPELTAAHLGPYQSAEGYVKFFEKIWTEGDPSGWNASIFTPDATMIDPTGTTNTGHEAAQDFVLLFKYFPDLRGRVLSWAANKNEIFINWRFVIGTHRISVCDKFCLSNGLVSYRLAYFDSVAMLSYLSDVYDYRLLYRYFKERYRGRLSPNMRKLIVALFRGAVMTKFSFLFGEEKAAAIRRAQ